MSGGVVAGPRASSILSSSAARGPAKPSRVSVRPAALDGELHELAGRAVRFAELRLVERGDLGREVAAGDLGGRPPEGVPLGLALFVRPADAAADPAPAAAGEQDAAQHGMERLGSDVGPGPGGDRLGRGAARCDAQQAGQGGTDYLDD